MSEFTETHRETLERALKVPHSGPWEPFELRDAIIAALAEIDRLETELARLESIRKAEYGS